jgi:isoleucyl-tRNA synthetase
MPLKELIIFHPDPEYIDDVKSLESYISAELNVVNITYTSDESSVGIKYRATADYPVLGRKLRKDIGKVRNGIPALGSEECKAYLNEKRVLVNGVELVEGDLNVTRFVEQSPEDKAAFETDSDGDVIILLDIRIHAELESQSLLRSLTARVNKLRKEAGLKPVDKVDVVYTYEDGEEDTLKGAIAGNEEFLERTIGTVPVPSGQSNGGGKLLVDEKKVKGAGEEKAGKEEKFTLSLYGRE